MGAKNYIEKILFLSFHFLLLTSHFASALTDEEILKYQSELKDKPIGEKIAFWAEGFVGAPYDNDPQGEYVNKSVIVADERVDCMYLTFRTIELALSNTPEKAIEIALDKRFHSRGILEDDKVINYYDRFEYGEDMIYSDKWGEEITSEIGRVTRIKGSREIDFIDILAPEELIKGIKNLKTGDIIFFIKDSKKRISEELVGHIGIIKIEHRKQNTEHRKENREVYLIHASGIKGSAINRNSGVVKKVLFKDYIRRMPFVGAKVTRFH